MLLACSLEFALVCRVFALLLCLLRVCCLSALSCVCRFQLQFLSPTLVSAVVVQDVDLSAAGAGVDEKALLDSLKVIAPSALYICVLAALVLLAEAHVILPCYPTSLHVSVRFLCSHVSHSVCLHFPCGL